MYYLVLLQDYNICTKFHARVEYYGKKFPPLNSKPEIYLPFFYYEQNNQIATAPKKAMFVHNYLQ
jgi:hypothetical protein